MQEHPYGWLSVAPPLATVLLAIVTRRAVASLLAGLFVGSMILAGGDPLAATVQLFEGHLWATLCDPWQVRLFGFLLLIGAMIGVVNRGGGMHGLVRLITPLAKTRRSGQIATWLAGLVVFFDDYTNTLLVGATMRPTCDRLRISREKLAYLVDSTAAPVAGIALLSTWVAVELDYIDKGLQAVDPTLLGDYTKLGVFMGCLPYRFYIIQALCFVPIVALAGRDFGPMLHAERKRSQEPPAEPGPSAGPAAVTATHWGNAVAPLGVTLAVVLALIVQTGYDQCWTDTLQSRREARNTAMLSGAEIAGAVERADNRWPGALNELIEASEAKTLGGDELERLREKFAPTAQEVFGAADTSLALFYGALVGLGVALTLSLGRGLLTKDQAADAAFAGVRSVTPGMMILLLATTMSGMTRGDVDHGGGDSPRYPQAAERLYTGDFLQALLPRPEEGGAASTAVAVLLPTVVFLMASVVAFSTGTSFGTMGILFPVVAPVAFATLGPTAGPMASEPMLLATFGAVLSGAIFGDHCSPISDTTVLSSQASGCDHVAHVVTQLPYALTVATVCVVLGTAPLALGVSVWWLLPLQTAALVGVLFLFGQRVEGGGG